MYYHSQEPSALGRSRDDKQSPENNSLKWGAWPPTTSSQGRENIQAIGLALHSPWFQQAQLCKKLSLLHFSHGEPGAYRGWLVWTRLPSGNWKSQDPRSCLSWLKDFIFHVHCFQHKRNHLSLSPGVHQKFTNFSLGESILNSQHQEIVNSWVFKKVFSYFYSGL